MAESTELVCPSCQKRYRVPGDLGGKHVKCRGCGKIFAVPGKARDGGPSGLADLSELAAEPDFDSTDNISYATWRPNFKHKFPLAASLDFYLPIVLLSVGVLWTIIQTAVTPHATAAWIWITRLLLVYLLYFFAVIPLALAGLRFAAAKLLFQLPEHPRWRMVAVCILPVMLAYVLWLVNGGAGGFLAGLFAGLLLTSFAFWFLFRPQGEEIAPSFGAMGGGLLGGVLLSFLVMLFINYLTNTAMDSYHAAGQFAVSPMGPGFPWHRSDVPQNSAPGAPALADARPASAAPAATQPETQPIIAIEPSIPDVIDNSGAPSDAFAAAIFEKHLPFIKEVRDDVEPAEFDLMFRPNGYSPWMATVRRQLGSYTDLVQCWDLRTWTPGPSATFLREINATAYGMSPDGKYVARQVSFPRSGCQIWSITDSRVACRIDPEYAEPPELIGFSDPRTLVTQGRRSEDEVVELHSVPDGVLIRSTIVPTHSHSPGNCQLSPDGKWLAIAARVNNQTQVLLYDLALPGKPQSLPIRAFDPLIGVQAAGIAFAPDLSRITALFERDGEAICFSWSLPDGSPQPDRTLLGVWPNLNRTAAEGARVIDYLGPDHVLVDGRGVLDMNSGKIVATLAPEPSTQWLSDAQTIQLLHRNSDTHAPHIITIKFDPTKFAPSVDAPSGTAKE